MTEHPRHPEAAAHEPGHDDQHDERQPGTDAAHAEAARRRRGPGVPGGHPRTDRVRDAGRIGVRRDAGKGLT